MAATENTRTISREKISKGPVAIYVLLVMIVCIPIWSVDHFVNQDGSSHVYGASIMLDLLISGSMPHGPVGFNPVPVPNSSGHWLLVLFLTSFSVFTATKLILLFIYALFVASVGWLRWTVYGTESLGTAVLMAGVVGLNWLWLIGTYSFLLGTVLMFGIFGLFVYWEARLNWKRTLILAALLLVIYFTHLIGFALLIGMIVMHCLIVERKEAFKTIGKLLIATLPVVPFLFAYRTLSEAGGSFEIRWLLAKRGLSLTALFEHFRSMDPFSLISRRALPMVEQTSDLYSLASPVIWIVIAVAVAGLSALASGVVEEPRRRIDASFLALFGLFAAISVVAPDEIGLHGGVIRPRFFVLAVVVFAAVFRFRNNFRAERFVQGILVLVFIFQVAALYDYANRSDATARNFLAAGDVIEAGDTVASIIVVEPSPRSLSHPEIQLSSIFAVVNRVFAWDNYEFGYYQFPVFVADRADREFALKFNFAKVYTSDTYDDELEQKLTVLGEILSANPEKIDKLLMWGKNERIEAILSTSFNMTPIFENRAVRVFRNARRSNIEKLNAH